MEGRDGREQEAVTGVDQGQQQERRVKKKGGRKERTLDRRRWETRHKGADVRLNIFLICFVFSPLDCVSKMTCVAI